MHRGLINVFAELLTYRHGNEFMRIPIPKSWVGKSFNDMLVELKNTKNAILVAVHKETDSMIVNPENHVFEEGDQVVVICKGTLEL